MKKYPFWKMMMDYSIVISTVIILLPLLILLLLLASLDTGFPGIFTQKRIGRNAKLFTIYKFRTLSPKTFEKSTIGNLMRRTKLDELPQLFNILKGDMSLVGPRPDIPGYYDKLEGKNRLILFLKPGITSEAGIKYRNEEQILSEQKNPLQYNDGVLFPDKVRMNLDYYHNLSFKNDIVILLKTLLTLRT
ncbi:sugar transferase [Chryseobacterium paludis]|uniref:sugar transferase n=1 Tax=Chryseobacterium paludis TaxID=2956784 RepID=UPI0036F2E91C